MESGYGEILQWLVGASLGAVVVLIVASLAVCDRLRKIHHSVRNIEHFAKHLHHSAHQEWRGEQEEAPFKDSDG